MRDLLIDLEAGELLSDPDPVRRARNQIRGSLPKRFYKAVSVAPVDNGFAVHLDGRPSRTPGRAVLALPTEPLARIAAAEYDAQTDVIDPVTMPVLRIANTAIDGVSRQSDAVLEDILRFASSDLLCYRADAPERLVAKQNELWDPVLDWAAEAIGARMALAEGVMHVAQPPAAMTALSIYLRQRQAGPFWLTAVHLMTSLTGSALLALAVETNRLSPEEAWRAAHVDEDWQIEHWGQDSEAVARRNVRWRDMAAAASVIEALGPGRQLSH